MGLNVMCTGGSGQKVFVDNTLGSASEYDIMSSIQGELFSGEIDVAMLNNKAYIFGADNTYEFDGQSVTPLNVVVPRANHRSCITYYDGKILALGDRITVFDGRTVSDFSYQYQGSYGAVGIASLNSDLFLFTRYMNGSSGNYYIKITKLINGQWVDILDLGSSVFEPDESILATFNGKIYIIGGKYTSANYNWATDMYQFDGTSASRVVNDSYVARGRVSVYDGKMHIMYPFSRYTGQGREVIFNADGTKSIIQYTINNDSVLAYAWMNQCATRVKVNGVEYLLPLYGGIIAKKTADNNINIVSLIET